MRYPFRSFRRSLGRVLAVAARAPGVAIQALPVVLLGCRFFACDIPLRLEFPEIPEHWAACFGDPAWLVVVPGTVVEQLVDAGRNSLVLELPKNQHQPVLSYPIVFGGGCHLPPAAAVYPLDLSVDRRTLALRWEQGPAGELLRRLIAQGVATESLNVSRLCREIRERLGNDPWSLDLDRAAARLASGAFRVTDLRSLDCRQMRIPVEAGRWFLESPFFSPISVPAEAGPLTNAGRSSKPGAAVEQAAYILSGPAELVLPSVPLGYHRLFEVHIGWVADLWVGEKETLWVPKADRERGAFASLELRTPRP
jgi:hypothetical protein